MSEAMTERTVRIVNRAGLHARPAAQLVQIASRFGCDLEVGKDGLMVNAKSIMGVMMLAAECGSEIQVRGRGDCAAEAVEEIVALVERGFGEER